MLQLIIVYIIISVACAWSIWSIIHSFKKRKQTTSICGNCNGCSVKVH